MESTVRNASSPGEDEFDLSEDLESSLQMFNGMLRSKDDEITRLKLESNELHR
jgi:hypothetical protein